jgi:hypothetical protein
MYNFNTSCFVKSSIFLFKAASLQQPAKSTIVTGTLVRVRRMSYQLALREWGGEEIKRAIT